MMDYGMERLMKPLTGGSPYHDDPYDVHVEKNVRKALEKYWLKHDDGEHKTSDISVKFQRTIKRMLRISVKSLKK